MLKQMKGKVGMKGREEKGKGSVKDWEGREGKGRKESKEAKGSRTGKGKDGYRKDRKHERVSGKFV